MRYLSPCRRQTLSSHCVIAHVMLILGLHFIRQGPSELFWEGTATPLLSRRDVSNSNWDLWPTPRGVQLLYLCSCPSVCVCMGSSPLYVHACTLAPHTWALHVCSAFVQMKQDAIHHSQVNNSGTQRGMNTLVSVADEGDEQRRGVMGLLSILPGNYSAIYYNRKGGGGGGRERSYHI